MTLLMTAAAAGDEVSVSALLAAGARPMAIDKRGRTALWHAANQGALPAVRQLTGVSPLDAADAEGTTALATAAARGADAIVSVLLSAGADPGIASKSGNIPLHFASAAGHAQTVSLLASGTGNIDAVNRHRDTALILAVKSRCPECVRTLLAAGASARLRNSDSLTAADVARLTGDAALAALLD